MAGTLTITGLISKFNWTSLIADIINSKKAYALKPYSDSKTKYENKLSTWQDFYLKLKTITEFIKENKLEKKEGWFGLKYSLSAHDPSLDGNSFFEISIQNSANKGSYELETLSVAQKEKISSDPYSSSNDPLSLSGKIIVGGIEVKIEESYSLSQIASAINNSASNVYATVLKITDGEYRLVLEAKDEGESGIVLEDPDGILTTLGILDSYGNKKNVIRSGQDAKIKIDGFEITSPSNILKDVIPGVIIKLKGVTTPVIFTLKIDEERGELKKVEELLSRINSLLSFIQSQNTYEEGQKKPLLGDVNLTSVKNSLVGAVYTEVNGNTTYRTLSSIGISFMRDGLLSINESLFSEALSKKPEEVLEVLTNFTGRIFERLNLLVDPYSGAFKNIESSIKSQISQIDRRMKEIEERFERERKMLERKYSALELLISESNLIKNWMENQIRAMSSSR